MKANITSIIVTAGFFLIGLQMGRQPQPSVQERKASATTNFTNAPICMMAGAVRGTREGKEIVYLPGVRVPFREEDWSESVWIPVASMSDIAPQEKVLTIQVRPSLEEFGWVVFESQRAVLLPRVEIAQLLVNRFAAFDEVLKLWYKRPND